MSNDSEFNPNAIDLARRLVNPFDSHSLQILFVFEKFEMMVSIV